MGRPEQRNHLTNEVRIELAERDLDEMIEVIESINGRMSKILWTWVGMLVSVTTASILLVLNLIVAGQ